MGPTQSERLHFRILEIERAADARVQAAERRADELAAQLADKRDREVGLRLALEDAATWFEEYAAGHEAKGATDKAARNRSRAEFLRQHLAEPSPRADAVRAVYQKAMAWLPTYHQLHEPSLQRVRSSGEALDELVKACDEAARLDQEAGS